MHFIATQRPIHVSTYYFCHPWPRQCSWWLRGSLASASAKPAVLFALRALPQTSLGSFGGSLYLFQIIHNYNPISTVIILIEVSLLPSLEDLSLRLYREKTMWWGYQLNMKPPWPPDHLWEDYKKKMIDYLSAMISHHSILECWAC